jgi:DNA-binding response OmpR family regulator
MSRILLVDDDPDIVETLRFAFEHEAYSVEVAHDGTSALRAARRCPPDVAVLDVMLPGMNGYEVSRQLKQDIRAGHLPEFRVLMLTARRIASAARRDFVDTWSQADATLWKPFDLNSLLATVSLLARGEAPIRAGEWS